MKNSLLIICVFTLGGMLGAHHWVPSEWVKGNTTMLILYALILQVGIGIGSNKNLKEMLHALNFKMLLVPLSTIAGTLLFSFFASFFLTHWGTADCMAVGSGFAYYSLSSVLITEIKSASVGVQVAAELGTLALLANIIREMISLLGAPFFTRVFGRLAPISAAGINSMDVMLPLVYRYSGKKLVPLAILHGIILEMSVPLLISFFCR